MGVMESAAANRDPMLPTAPEPFFPKKLVLGVAALVMVVGFFSFVFSIFYFGISSGVYALVSIVWFEAINMTGAVPHVFLPDSGLESIIRICLGADSPARHTAIFMQTEEGFHRIFMSVVDLFVAFHAQEYKWYFLGHRLVELVCEDLKKTFLIDLTCKGEFLANAPGRFRSLMHLSIMVRPF